MRVFRRRRIQDYQLRSTNDPNDTKLFDDNDSGPSIPRTTELDDITMDVRVDSFLYILLRMLLRMWDSGQCGRGGGDCPSQILACPKFFFLNTEFAAWNYPFGENLGQH